MILNCNKLADEYFENIKIKINEFKQQNIYPHIAIIKWNSDIACDKYIDIKIKKAAELGVQTTVIKNINSVDELNKKINELNNNSNIHGYIIQLPLPTNVDNTKIFEKINIRKDLDGLSVLSITKNIIGSKDFFPKSCTAEAIIKIIENQKINLNGKNVVIVNRSPIIGKPLIGMLLNKNATVTICHSHTKHLCNITKQADILITAVGQPKFMNKRYIKPNSFVIDAGICFDKNNNMCGDVNTESVVNYAKYITPVPGGVGKVSIAILFNNLVKLITQQIENEKNNNSNK